MGKVTDTGNPVSSLYGAAVTEVPIRYVLLHAMDQGFRNSLLPASHGTLPIVLSSCSYFKPLAMSLDVKGSGSDHKCYTNQPVWIKCCHSL